MTPSFDSLQFGSHLDIAARSHAGFGSDARSENQDNYLLIDTRGMATFLEAQLPRQQQLDHWTPGHVRLAVLDGMGGHGHGREAAEAVVAGLLALAPCSSLEQLSDALDVLHARLQQQFESGDDPGKRPGTTLTMLELRPGAPALLYHVGDSRLYQIVHGRVMPMTIDHVPATACAMEGELDESEWWRQVHCEDRSQISQAFILGNAFDNPTELSDPLCALSERNLPPYLHAMADRRAFELDPDAVYILATDGFWACERPAAWLERWPQLLAGLPGAPAMCARLFEEMQERPPHKVHPDNLTAIVLRARSSDETALPLEH